ncbi:MAG: hypothetical protein OEZ34_15975 [Spirochaetia bacterium]|nr:hypothetical protein [Spirochaetia bacterium]
MKIKPRHLFQFVFIFFINLTAIPFLELAICSFTSSQEFIFVRIFTILSLLLFSFFSWKIITPIAKIFFTDRIIPGRTLLVYFIIILTGSLFFFYKIYNEPEGMWDASSRYNMMAKHYALEYIENNRFMIYKSFWDGNPPFYSLQISFLIILWGNWSIFIPIILSYLYFIAISILLFSFYDINQNKILNPGMTAIALSVIYPSVSENASHLCADVPIAFYLIMTLSLFFIFINSIKKHSSIILIFIIFSGSILTSLKNEGVLLLIPFLIMLYFSAGKRIEPIRFFLIFFLVSLPSFTLLAASKFTVDRIYVKPLNLEIFLTNFTTIARYKLMIKYFFTVHVLHTLGVPFYLIFKSSPSSLRYFLPLGASFILYHFVFIINDFDLVWLLETAYRRITFHFYPALSLIVLYTLNTERKHNALFHNQHI